MPACDDGAVARGHLAALFGRGAGQVGGVRPQGELDAGEDEEEEDGKADDEVREPLFSPWSANPRTSRVRRDHHAIGAAAGGTARSRRLDVVGRVGELGGDDGHDDDDAATTRAVTTTHEAISPRSSAEIEIGPRRHIGAQEAERGPLGRLEGRARQRADLLSVTGGSDRWDAPWGSFRWWWLDDGSDRLGTDHRWLPVKAARAG